MRHADQFGVKVVRFEKRVGFPVTHRGNRDRKNQYKRTGAATRTVERISLLPKGFRLPRPCETHRDERHPKVPICDRTRDAKRQTMRTLWPTGAYMRSKEVEMTMLVKGQRTDPLQVWMYQTLTMLRTTLAENSTWIPLWQQAW